MLTLQVSTLPVLIYKHRFTSIDLQASTLPVLAFNPLENRARILCGQITWRLNGTSFQSRRAKGRRYRTGAIGLSPGHQHRTVTRTVVGGSSTNGLSLFPQSEAQPDSTTDAKRRNKTTISDKNRTELTEVACLTTFSSRLNLTVPSKINYLHLSLGRVPAA